MSARFPFADRPRLWGTAVSHYQVEGNDECDWSAWTREKCGAAIDSWSRYEADADLARAAGANAFRFSVSWSRIEPQPGGYDDAALARYVRLVEHLRRIGLEPCVTLFHYTHPVWFHERTPWTSTKSIERFAAFAARVVDAFGDQVRFYIPLNEPLVFALAAFYDAQVPPAIAGRRAFRNVVEHLLRAHAAAAAVIREKQPRAAIGVAHNMMAFAPERPHHVLDRLLARIAHRCYNRGLIEAFATGRWDFVLPPATRVRGRIDDLPKLLDVFGVNFYSRLHLRCPGKTRLVGDFAYRDATGYGLTDNGWEIVPGAFGPLLEEAAKSGFPIIVTENGLADANDRIRARFLEEHAAAMPDHVSAYFHWSLADNFEWLDGYGPKFGLYAVDRATMQRTPRPSVETFRRLGERFLASTDRIVCRTRFAK